MPETYVEDLEAVRSSMVARRREVASRTATMIASGSNAMAWADEIRDIQDAIEAVDRAIKDETTRMDKLLNDLVD